MINSNFVKIVFFVFMNLIEFLSFFICFFREGLFVILSFYYWLFGIFEGKGSGEGCYFFLIVFVVNLNLFMEILFRVGYVFKVGNGFSLCLFVV